MEIGRGLHSRHILPAPSGKSFIHGGDDRHTSVSVDDSLEGFSHTKEIPGATAGASGVATGLSASSQDQAEGRKGRAKLSSWPSGSSRWKKRSPHSASRGAVDGWNPAARATS